MSKKLVAYFSASGVTAKVAETLAEAIGADICAGSGTTAIAAINTERRFVCFETAPSFYAAASERIRAAQAVKSSGEKGV